MIHTAVAWGDIRDRSYRRLPRLLFDYVEGGGFDESTIARNRNDLDAVPLRQRVLTDVVQVDTSCTLLGRQCAMPLILGPVGFAGMLARRGEVQAARAAATAGIPFVLSTFGICSVEEVAEGCGAAPWVQLYVLDDEAWLADFLARISSVGVDTLFLTVDVPVPGIRYREAKRPLQPGPAIGARLARIGEGLSHPRWLYDVYLRGRPHSFGNMPQGRPGRVVPVTPALLSRVRALWSGRLVVKGLLDPEDAVRAVDRGADALVVSNHGGRQMAGIGSAIGALGPIVDAVGSRVPVLMDGGIQGGLDMLRATVGGARGCLTGRGWAHALAAGGEQGVARMLRSWQQELAVAMQLTGLPAIPADNRG